MKKIISVIIDYEKSQYLDKNLIKNNNSFKIVKEKVCSLGFPFYIFSSLKRNDSIGFQGDLFSLLKEIDKKIESYDHILFFHSEMPLVDMDITSDIIETHTENIADYTFGEHFPDGVSPFIINKGSFKKIFLMSRGNNEEYTYQSIVKLINLDINSYDVEIVISPEDLRIIREVFRIHNKRSFKMVKDLLKFDCDMNHLYNHIKTNPTLLRPFPSYIIIELSTDCNQNCIYCPFCLRDNKDKNMSATQFKETMGKINEWIQTGYVELSGYGEPLMNPDIEEILDTIKEFPDFIFFLETNGILLKDKIDKLASIPNLNVIISIDAPSKSLYEVIRRTGDFNLVEENIEKFLTQATEKGYIALTRMKDNENEIETFLERWRSFQDRIIINKYNDFCGRFPDRKVVDLSPLNRFACWKLQRELFIQADGIVSLCSQDFDNSNQFGNVFEDPLEEIWGKINFIYSAHWQENYTNICNKCDQWYSFSF